MNNLFSMFDPSSSTFSITWVLPVTTILLIPKSTWTSTDSVNKTKLLISTKLKKELSSMLVIHSKYLSVLFMTLFMTILVMNLTAIYPQIFSLTSHLTITLPLASLFWTTVFLYGWANKTKMTLSHLLPQSTPTGLMPLMVLIELISSLIRPITLCVRLTANLIAGHMLMSLLGNFILSMNSQTAMMTFFAPITLTILEAAVAIIQSYVFMTLISLYTSELK